MGFAISVGLVCVIGAMAIWQIGKVYQKTEEISAAILPTVQALSDVRSMANTVRRTTLRGLPKPTSRGAMRSGRRTTRRCGSTTAGLPTISRWRNRPTMHGSPRTSKPPGRFS
nr:hypothetical protein [Burkholderia glumae]